MKKINLIFAALFFHATFILFSCVSGTQTEINFSQKDLVPSEYEWHNLTETGSIKHAKYLNNECGIKYHLVQIDFSKNSIMLKSYPAEKNSDGIKFIKVQEFAQKENLIVAINATPFVYKTATKGQPVGIWKSCGILISKPEYKYSQLSIKTDSQKNGSVLYADIQPIQENTETENIFGGFFTILFPEKDFSYSYKNIKDSRTAAGISKDGKTLWILSVEGKSTSAYKGLSYADCAFILEQAGCTAAIEFDGGNSTSLCINGKDIINSGFTINPRSKVTTMFGFKEVR